MYIKQIYCSLRGVPVLVLFLYFSAPTLEMRDRISFPVVNENTCGIRISGSFRETQVFSRSRQFLYIFRKIGRFGTMLTTLRYLAL
jgi:hypothetical protein